jgi:hypothetical protein
MVMMQQPWCLPETCNMFTAVLKDTKPIGAVQTITNSAFDESRLHCCLTGGCLMLRLLLTVAPRVLVVAQGWVQGVDQPMLCLLNALAS